MWKHIHKYMYACVGYAWVCVFNACALVFSRTLLELLWMKMILSHLWFLFSTFAVTPVPKTTEWETLFQLCAYSVVVVFSSIGERIKQMLIEFLHATVSSLSPHHRFDDKCTSKKNIPIYFVFNDCRHMRILLENHSFKRFFPYNNQSVEK